ncbi:hypothetical protein FQA39_LY17943 [Lamprigera yunnana]|nr:hypothetical protein FQA39_LY17943 [Lamprigera yunnana]
MSVDKFGQLPRTSVHTDKNHIENLILKLNQLESSVNDDINAIIGIIPTAIKSIIDAVFKAMFDENLHLTRFTSMEAAFCHILNRVAEIESTAAITAHIFSILVTKFNEDNLFKSETFDTMWKPRQIGSKTLTFEMIEEKKNLKIKDMPGNKVYLGLESVSEVWSLQSILRYRLSYSSGSNFKHFYEDVIRAVAEMSGDVKINIYNVINRLSEKSDDVCCMLEVLLFMPEKALFDVQLERRIEEQEKQFMKKMWVLHAEQHWTKAINLKSAVESLYEKLSALEFDADHEAIYGMER